MEAQTPRHPEPDQLLVPSRGRVWFGRGLIVFIVGLMLFASFLLYRRPVGDEVRAWQTVVMVTAWACVAPLLVLGWSGLSRPYPHDRTMLVLTRALHPAERKAVAAALRRAEPIDPAHHAYARASVAQQQRSDMYFMAMPAMMWSQSLNAAATETGSGWFWTVTVGAVGYTTVAAGGLLIHLRMERTVRGFAGPGGGSRQEAPG